MITVAETRESREPSVTLLNQSSDEPSTTTTGGEQSFYDSFASSSLLFFLATSFSSGWLGKQATFSIGQIPINNRPEWWGRRPSLLQWKGGNRRFTAAPLQLPFAQHDHERRQRIA